MTRLDLLVEEAVSVLQGSGAGKTDGTHVRVRIETPWYHFIGPLSSIDWAVHNDVEVQAAIVYAAAALQAPTKPADSVAKVGEALYYAKLQKSSLKYHAFLILQGIKENIWALGYKRIRLEDMGEFGIWDDNASRILILANIADVRVFYTWPHGSALYAHESQYLTVMLQIRGLDQKT